MPNTFTLHPYPVPKGERPVHYPTHIAYAEERVEQLIDAGAEQVSVFFRGENIATITRADVEHARADWQHERAIGRDVVRTIPALRAGYHRAAERDFELPQGKRKREVFFSFRDWLREVLPPERAGESEKLALELLERIRPYLK